MAAVASLPAIRANENWQYGDPSLTDLRISLLDRGQSEQVTRRKRSGSSRHSWRWSWKQVFIKPFQNQSWTRGGGSRGKRKKRKSENITKNSVETRKKMDELYRLWFCDDDDSSEESSDEEYSERYRRRSCIPRIFSSDSSSSGSDTDCEVEEPQVSEYVREGPSRMKVDINQEHERISVDLGGIPSASSQVSDTSGFELIPSQKQRTIEVIDFTNPVVNGFEESMKEFQSLFKAGSTSAKIDLIRVPEETQSLKKYGVIDMKRYSCNLATPQLIPQSVSETTDKKVIAITSNITVHGEHSQKPIFTSAHSTAQDHDLITNDSYDTVNNEEGHQDDRTDPDVTTRQQGMINICRNNSAITEQQIHPEDILKRVDELCAQCGDNRNQIELSVGLYSDIPDESLESSHRENNEENSFNGNSFHPKAPQESCPEKSNKKPATDVVPDYPSSYLNTGTFRQMSSYNQEHYSKVHCEFQRFGCHFSGTEIAVDQHMKSNLNGHLKLVSKLALDQKERIECQQMEQQKQSLLIQQLTDTVNNLERLVREQNQASQSQEKTMLSLKDQVKDQRKQNQRFEREITNQVQSLNQSEMSSLPATPCAAEFVWPIRNFRKRLRRIRDGDIDDPLISEPFYTGSYGYKLSIWVYLNGRGKTLGDWISVYARVMPSDHDNILDWPVRPMYTFTLLDQSEGEKEHIVRKRKVNDIRRDGGKHHGIHRPEGGERSVIVGFDDFIAHAQLEKRKYMVDDCIYLKLEADIMS